jgi:hypothetical protein
VRGTGTQRAIAATSKVSQPERTRQALITAQMTRAAGRGLLQECLLQRVKADEGVIPFHSESDLLVDFVLELQH